jgi:3-deoxy-D-manno-octulosonic-acid transferase
MVLINGRMSPRSFPRWRRMYGTISALLSRFDICLAQSKLDAERFSALGGRDVLVTGNLKLDVPAPPADPAKLERLMAMTRGRPIIVAASTHPGEDEMLVAAHRNLVGFFPQLLTVIVPRHPDRGSSISGMITASGLKPALRSRDEPLAAATDVYVADTMGELGLFYRLAPVVFVAGSYRWQGHNPIEPALLGAAIVSGPQVANFQDIFARMAKADAVTLAAESDLAGTVDKLLGQSQVAAGQARAFAQAEGAGILERVVAALEPVVSAGSSSPMRGVKRGDI